MLNEPVENNADNQPPQPEVEDIFAEVEELSAGPVKKEEPKAAPQLPGRPRWLSILIYAIVFVVVVLIISFAIYFVFGGKDQPKDEIEIQTEVSETTDVPESQEVAPVTPAQDTDGDRVIDSVEQQYSTDLNKADTDDDGLDDFAEIFTYKTNPLKADTDDDGFLDGAEVEKGYNPNGTGTLNP